MNDNASPAPRKHTLQLDQRKTAVISGVLDVSSFHEDEIVLKTDSGIMILSGSSLHIGKLLLEDGRVDVDGQIDSIVYEKLHHNIKNSFSWMRRFKNEAFL